MTLKDKLHLPGPKRILALDGGGIKGALTLGFLQRIEDLRINVCIYISLFNANARSVSCINIASLEILDAITEA